MSSDEKKNDQHIHPLWAPWRMEHIQRTKDGKAPQNKTPDDCVFCDLVTAACDEESLKLYQSELCFIVMNRFPYNPNHLLIIPNSHTMMMPDLAPGVWTDMSRCLKATVDLLMERIAPHGLNIGLNMGEAGGASIANHLHFHILPRWKGDTNFMPLLAETKSIPVHNRNVYQNLAPHFADFDKFLKEI